MNPSRTVAPWHATREAETPIAKTPNANAINSSPWTWPTFGRTKNSTKTCGWTIKMLLPWRKLVLQFSHTMTSVLKLKEIQVTLAVETVTPTSTLLTLIAGSVVLTEVWSWSEVVRTGWIVSSLFRYLTVFFMFVSCSSSFMSSSVSKVLFLLAFLCIFKSCENHTFKFVVE